ncbi:phosphotransferase [Microbacterium sp. NPDC077663]|uniref:phosphotransferase n=1 Tax=Microbacterium sp. NPDC077663 TaxID=3364189 RepID=UPI0037CA0C95
MPREEPLAGGNASGVVVRVGDTVRKPWTVSTPSVTAYLGALRSAGVDVPEALGRDEAGRQILEFVPGELAIDRGRMTESGVRRVGAMVRAIHDASATWTAPVDSRWATAIPAPGVELVCHNDLAPWNLVVGDDRWVFIDWDAAGPSTRLWDLAYAAQSFTLNDTSVAPDVAAAALATFVDAYGADDDLRRGLPDAMAARAAAMHDLLRRSHAAGVEPWAAMFSAGHGHHWRVVTDYVREHRQVWTAALAG